jgi:hypothetical protein
MFRAWCQEVASYNSDLKRHKVCINTPQRTTPEKLKTILRYLVIPYTKGNAGCLERV